MPATAAESPCMYAPRMDVYLNHWFTSYEEARNCLENLGGFLFPYRRYFFVTTAQAIVELGLDPEDPDWALIGWDWVHPSDAAAWERLKLKREIAA